MDSLLLPYLEDQDTLRSALEKMRQADSRSIVVNHVVNHVGYQPRLYMNREVVNAVCDNMTLCGELPRDLGQRIGTFDHLLDITNFNSMSLYDFVERSLDQQDVMFGIPFLPLLRQPLVLVVTRHETLARTVAFAAKVCMCPDNHTCESPPNPENGSCAIDGKAYECY